MRAVIQVGFGLLATVAASGCLAVAVGGGAAGVAYVLGDIEKMYPLPIDVVWSATQTALAELELPPGFDSKDQLRAKIDRRTAAGDRVRITLASHGQFTKLTLRVNTFGNKGMSQVIIRQIESHLPAPALEPPGGYPVPPASLPPEAGETIGDEPTLNGPLLDQPG